MTRYYDEFIEYASWYNLLGTGTHEINGETLNTYFSWLAPTFGITLTTCPAASIPLALNHAFEQHRLSEGKLVLLEAMGGGFTWGALLVRW